MIVTGAFDTIGTPSIHTVYKTQNKQFVTEGHVQKYFFHPFMQVHSMSSQVTAMFLGEMMSLPIYYILKAQDPAGHKLK